MKLVYIFKYEAMNIEKLILNKAKTKGAITVAEIIKETRLSRSYISRFFQKLTENSKLAKIGHTNRSRYVLASKKSVRMTKRNILSFNRIFENRNLQEDRVMDLIKAETGISNGIRNNISRILEYAFTEMLNNAIEHSGSARIKIAMKREDDTIRFDVIDWGVGIFEKLIHSRHLENVDEAIQDLLKGKQTTDPDSHSGEGIFFTRRIADVFIIRSSTKKLFFNNLIDDFVIATIKPIFGTRVTFSIATNSHKELDAVFKQYTGQTFEFSTTEVTVKLYERGATTFISRSQARRILYGLEKFKKIILDFAKVRAVGQGFADEVFRVWHNKHPGIKIDVKNMVSDVDFMIKRHGYFK